MMLRSVLFVPGDKPRALEKAPSLGADALIIDLEDAVALAHKPAARTAAPAAIAQFRAAGCLAVIRVAEPTSAELQADLDAVADARPDAIAVAKVDHPNQLDAVRESMIQRNISVPIWAMIESPLAVMNLPAFIQSAASVGLGALVAGTNDLAEALRLPDGARRSGCEPHLAQLVLAARAAGLIALDGVYNAYRDTDGFLAEAKTGRNMGFDGKTLIHPSQVDPANAAFGPSETEVDWARQVVAAFEDPANAGKGAIPVNEVMVEAMHLRQAEAILATQKRG